MPRNRTQRVRIRELKPIPIFNTRKNFKLPTRKPYNTHRGKTGVLYGHQKSSGKYIVNIGKNEGIHVNAENVEFLNSPTVTSRSCKKCGRNPHEHTEEEMLKGVTGRDIHKDVYVPQDTFTITKNRNSVLYTYGLATCTAVGFTLNDYKFLAHISADTDITNMITKIRKIMKLTNDTPTDVNIWTGLGDDAAADIVLTNPSKRSLEKVYELITALNIDKLTIHDVCYAEIVP